MSRLGRERAAPSQQTLDYIAYAPERRSNCHRLTALQSVVSLFGSSAYGGAYGAAVVEEMMLLGGVGS